MMICLAGLVLVFSVFFAPFRVGAKEFLVGCNLSLSGALADVGIGAQRGVEWSVEIVNNKGGFVVQGEKYTLKPVYYDHKYVPAEAVANLEKILSAGIRFMFINGSGATVPLVEKTTAAKVLMLGSASGGKSLTATKYPYTFRIIPCNEAAFATYPWLIKTYPQIKKVAHINPSDEAGFTEAETRTKCAKNVGFTNVANEFFKRGATDYYPVSTRLVASNPDFIDFGGTGGRDQGLLAKALREVGYKGLIGISYASAAIFSQIAGADNAEGTLFQNCLAEPSTPGEKEVHDWYVKKYGPPVPEMFYNSVDPLLMLVEAVKKANSFDPVKVSETFRNLQWNSIYGPMSMGMEDVYGIKSSACRPIPTGVYRNGQLKHLATLPWPSDEQIRKLNAD